MRPITDYVLRYISRQIAGRVFKNFQYPLCFKLLLRSYFSDFLFFVKTSSHRCIVFLRCLFHVDFSKFATNDTSFDFEIIIGIEISKMLLALLPYLMMKSKNLYCGLPYLNQFALMITELAYFLFENLRWNRELKEKSHYFRTNDPPHVPLPPGQTCICGNKAYDNDVYYGNHLLTIPDFPVRRVCVRKQLNINSLTVKLKQFYLIV